MRRTALFLLLLLAGCAPAVRDTSFSDSDRKAALAGSRAYVDAWLANEPDGVMATFAPGATLVPSGQAAVTGDSAIRAFFWPPATPPITVSGFDAEVLDVTGSGDLAVVRGEAVLTWSATFDGTLVTRSQRSTYVDVLGRGSDGRWRIVQRSWSDRR